MKDIKYWYLKSRDYHIDMYGSAIKKNSIVVLPIKSFILSIQHEAIADNLFISSLKEKENKSKFCMYVQSSNVNSILQQLDLLSAYEKNCVILTESLLYDSKYNIKIMRNIEHELIILQHYYKIVYSYNNVLNQLLASLVVHDNYFYLGNEKFEDYKLLSIILLESYSRKYLSLQDMLRLKISSRSMYSVLYYIVLLSFDLNINFPSYFIKYVCDRSVSAFSIWNTMWRSSQVARREPAKL